MKKRTIILIILFIAIAVGIFFILPMLKPKEKILYNTMLAQKKTILKTISATGILNAWNEVEVGTQVSGTISKIYVYYNDYVKKGQLLAKLDETIYKGLYIESQGKHEKAKVQLEQRKVELERYTALYNSKVISKQEFENYTSNYNVSETEYKTSEGELMRTKANLAYTNIYAPISGVVISKKVDEGQTVTASFQTPTLFTIADDLTKMKMLVSVDEADIGYIHTGQEVNFTVDAYPEKIFTGKVKLVRLEPVKNQNVVTYIVEVIVPNGKKELVPGMNATVEIKIEEKKNCMVATSAALSYWPSTEVVKDSSLNHIWVLKNGVPQMIEITKGISDGTFVEIISDKVFEKDSIIINETVKKVVSNSKSLLPSPSNK